MNFLKMMADEFKNNEIESHLNESKLTGGRVDAFGKTNRYTVKTDDSYATIKVVNDTGTVGSIIFDFDMGLALYFDDRNKKVHSEMITKVPTNAMVKNHYVPTLISRTSTDDMFA